MTSKRYFLFHKIYNLFLEKFLIKVSLVHAFLIKRLHRERERVQNQPPSVAEPLKSVLLIWLLNSFPSQHGRICAMTLCFTFLIQRGFFSDSKVRKQKDRDNASQVNKKVRMQNIIS